MAQPLRGATAGEAPWRRGFGLEKRDPKVDSQRACCEIVMCLLKP
jgi:hypothetical protein